MLRPQTAHAQFPVWLYHSGISQKLTDQRNGAAAWSVFHALVELDCQLHSVNPDTVEITLRDLSLRTALPAAQIRRAIGTLRKHKLVACWLPDPPEADEDPESDEPGLFKIQVPLKPPRSIRDILTEHPELSNTHLRYLHVETLSATDLADDDRLSEVADLYFNTCGLRMNSFILDELAMLTKRFSLEEIRRAFNRARANEIRSLQTIVRDMCRERKQRKEQQKEQEAAAHAI